MNAKSIAWMKGRRIQHAAIQNIDYTKEMLVKQQEYIIDHLVNETDELKIAEWQGALSLVRHCVKGGFTWVDTPDNPYKD